MLLTTREMASMTCIPGMIEDEGTGVWFLYRLSDLLNFSFTVPRDRGGDHRLAAFIGDLGTGLGRSGLLDRGYGRLATADTN